MTKIGFIFECGPQGADKQVCEFLASQIRTDIYPVSVTLDKVGWAGTVSAPALGGG